MVCRQFVYSGGDAILGCEYGEGTGAILLDDVNCIGLEESIFDCASNSWDHDCSHVENAGVSCEL